MPQQILYIILGAFALLALAAVLFFVFRKRLAAKPSKTALRFKKLILHEHGCTAEENEYELLKTENGVRISNYFGNWWDAGEGVHSRKNCLAKRRGGSQQLYNELAELLGSLGVASWNGFDETNPHVCDGGGFSLEIELENGETIFARGMNAYPPHYQELVSRLQGLFDRQS